MREAKNSLEKKWNERKAYKSSSWLHLLLKIILFVAVILLMKNLSIQDNEKKQNNLNKSSTVEQVADEGLYQ
jgi:hypothetical protein